MSKEILAKQLVSSDIFDAPLLEYVLSIDVNCSKNLPTWEDWENLLRYEDPEDWTERLSAHFGGRVSFDGDEFTVEETEETLAIGEAAEILGEAEWYVEIMQYYRVSSRLYWRLNYWGRPVLRWNGYYYWGRTTCGQGVDQDYVIQEIAAEILGPITENQNPS